MAEKLPLPGESAEISSRVSDLACYCKSSSGIDPLRVEDVRGMYWQLRPSLKWLRFAECSRGQAQTALVLRIIRLVDPQAKQFFGCINSPALKYIRFLLRSHNHCVWWAGEDLSLHALRH